MSDIKVFYVENFNSNVMNRIDPEIVNGIQKVVNHFENGHKLKVQKVLNNENINNNFNNNK